MFSKTMRAFRLPITALTAAMLLTALGCGSAERGGENDEELNVNEETNQQNTNQQNTNQQNDGDDDVFTVGGAVTGDLILIDDQQLVLANDADEQVHLDSPDDFTFETEYTDGDDYQVHIAGVPTDHECDIDNASGTIDGADVDDVEVTCQFIDEPGFDDVVFEVEIDGNQSTLEVLEGQTATAVAVVENTGDDEGTQEVTITADGDSSSESITLEPDATTELTYEMETEAGDAGDYTVEFASEDDSATATIIVEAAPAEFVVEIDEGESTLTVDEGDTATVVADVENTGGTEMAQDVVFEVDGDYVDMVEDLELEADETEQVSFDWETTPGDAGDYTAEVMSDDDSDTATIEVEQVQDSALFSVEIDEDASELVAVEGEPIVIETDVENTGDLTGTQDIELDIGGVFSATEADVEIDGGDSQSVTFTWDTADGDAGNYTAEVTSDDDSDTAPVTVGDADQESTVVGTVSEVAPGGPVEGIEVVLFEDGTDTVVDTDTTDSDGDYEIADVEPGDYQLGLRAPGLEPNYDIEEANGDNRLDVELVGGENLRDITFDWLDTLDLLVDGGMLDFQYENDDSIAAPFPECEQQQDGSWEPVEQDYGDDIEITFKPDDECFQINDIEVDLLTGALSVTTDDILFPDVEVRIEDIDEDLVEAFEFEQQWLFDDITGDVDFTDGSLAIDIDYRVLVGGTVETSFGNQHFGLRDNEYDCQLAEAWGGDITDPETDDDGEQHGGGDYLHDPIRMQLTTEESGPHGETGAAYDSDTDLGFAIVVDNEMEVDRLSEGEYGNDDPGGASCGDFSVLGESIDYAAEMNGQLDLPAGYGEVFGEFNFVLPLE